jgi:vacuolar-type H+-ATPase subunit H
MIGAGDEEGPDASRLSIGGAVVQGMDLVKNLAELERELATKLDEAHQSAEHRIASAAEEARHILAEADAQIRQMADTSKVRIAKENEKYAEGAHARAEAEAQDIREQAERNIDRAVDFILTEVLP